ncbi:MAG: hypothetical protein JRD89_03680 [Deltaproteobacteria bacterium]|nr:hypothetical protein [Deltaproteobacteria bacterium]
MDTEETGAVSQDNEETVSQKSADKETEQASTQDAKPDLDKMVQEAVAKALTSKTDEISRHFQSVKDKELQPIKKRQQEAERRAEAAEKALERLRQEIDDPDWQSRIDQEMGRSRLSYYESLEADRKKEEELRAKVSQELADIREEIKDMGVDPDSKEIVDAIKGIDPIANISAVRRAALKVARQIDRDAYQKKVDQSLAEKLADYEKRLGIHSVDDTPPVTAVKDIQPGDFSKAAATAKTPQELLKKLGRAK